MGSEKRTVVVKRGSQVFTTVFGIYRSQRLGMPKVGEELRVVNYATQEEYPGTVIAVHPETNRYDLRFLNAEHDGQEG